MTFVFDERPLTLPHDHVDTVMTKATKAPPTPRSQRLFDAGFKTLKDAVVCLQAVVADLAADRISATEANTMTAATGRWMRDYEKKLKEERSA
jgi:hypothetical protein